MRIINLLIIASTIVPFLKGCTQAPERKTLEDNSESIVEQVIKSELGKQALHNNQLDCYRYDDNSLLIFSEKGAKAIYSNDNSDFRHDYQKWEGHQQFFVTNFFDGRLLKYSVSKISFGDIIKAKKNSYICVVNIVLTTQIWNADYQPSFQVFSITPADWPDFNEEKQNNYIMNCIKKLPSTAYNYNYISSFIKPPTSHPGISFDICAPYWGIHESLTTLTLTFEWDIKNNSWVLPDAIDDSLNAFNSLSSWPPQNLDTDEINKKINNKQLFLQHNCHWDENGSNFLAKVDAGLVWFDGKWIHKEAQVIILSIYDDFKKLTISNNSTLPKMVNYILEYFNNILIKSSKLSSFADVEEYLSGVNNKITVTLFECIKLAVQNKDISTITKIEGKLSEALHWNMLNISDIKEECQKAKKQIAVNVWNDFQTTFGSANPTQEPIEKLLTIFPEYMTLFKENEQYLSKTILPMLTNWIQKYITSVISEEDISKLESLEDICIRKKLIAILPIDIPSTVELSKMKILENSTTSDQKFIYGLTHNRRITSEWAFLAINEIIKYCHDRVSKKIIHNENYLEMVKKIIDDCWGWNASAPLCSVEPEFRQKVNDDFKKFLFESEKEITEQANDKYRLIKPMEYVTVHLYGRDLKVRMIKYDATTKEVTISYSGMYKEMPLSEILTLPCLIDPHENSKAKITYIKGKMNVRRKQLEEEFTQLINRAEADAKKKNENNGYIFYQNKWFEACDLVEYILAQEIGDEDIKME